LNDYFFTRAFFLGGHLSLGMCLGLFIGRRGKGGGLLSCCFCFDILFGIVCFQTNFHFVFTLFVEYFHNSQTSVKRLRTKAIKTKATLTKSTNKERFRLTFFSIIHFICLCLKVLTILSHVY
jgi:hypothetical protein